MRSKVLIWEGVELLLMSQRTVYIPKYGALLLADWHLGKLGHFRQQGLFVPEMQLQEEFDRLGALFEEFNIKKVCFLGDLFHAAWNYEWDKLIAYLEGFPHIEFILTKGNHDIIPESTIGNTPLKICEYFYLDTHLVLSHQPLVNLSFPILNIVGHIHPGIEIYTAGRQRYRLPCFVLEGNILTLPAFGRWTGLYILSKTESRKYLAILGNEVVEI